MEFLNSDCLLSIFSHLYFPDCLRLRAVCRQLKRVIDNDFLPTVHSLSLYLTTSRTQEMIANYEDIFLKESLIRCHLGGASTLCSQYLSSEICIRRLSFGTPGVEAFEDGTMLQHQNHFRFEDFVIVNHSSHLSNLLSFFKNHCSNIHKLALVIDHCEHYIPEISQILSAFPAIKVLLLEKTLQDSCRFTEDISNVLFRKEYHVVRRERKNLLEPQEAFYNSIIALKNLKELFLFPKRESQLLISNDEDSYSKYFVETMLKQLKIFHLNFHGGPYMGARGEYDFRLPVNIERPFVRIQEFGCKDYKHFFTDLAVFPLLQKLFIFRFEWLDWVRKDMSSLKPNLKVLDVFGSLIITEVSMRNLNSFLCVEEFHCKSIELCHRISKNADLYMEWANETIKHIQLINIQNSRDVDFQAEQIRSWCKYFAALETVVVLEPEYKKYAISDLWNNQ